MGIATFIAVNISKTERLYHIEQENLASFLMERKMNVSRVNPHKNCVRQMKKNWCFYRDMDG